MTLLEKKHIDNRRRAHETRVALVLTLSPNGTCQSCGRKPKKVSSLQIDHVDGRDWTPREHNQWTRAYRYWREYRAGARMRALCRKCNGGYRPPGYYDKAQAEYWKKQLEQEQLTKMTPDAPKKTKRKTDANRDRDVHQAEEHVPF